MLRYILIAALLFYSSPVFAYGWLDVIQAYNAASSSGSTCNSSNDGVLHTDGNTQDAVASVGSWRANQFTTTDSDEITGIEVSVGDNGSTISVTCEIYTDSSNEPGSIYGAGFTATISNISDTAVKQEFLFASTQTLPAGTYWQVCKPSATADFGRDTTPGSGTYMYSSDSGSNWTSSPWTLIFGVIGCD